MATDSPSKAIKKKETLRQKANRASTVRTPRTRRLKTTASAAGRPFRAAHRVGKKEYYLPLPDNRIGRFLNKRRRFTPGFLINAWHELRQVQWPSFHTAIRLTLAVFIFSIIFGLLVTAIDFGLDKLFRKVFL